MPRLSFNDHADFAHLQQLSTPVWIFDVERHAMWWANKQGLAFWKAADTDELCARDFSSDSAIVHERLHQIVENPATDSHLTETWTLYPGGSPQTVLLSFYPVKIENQVNAVLVELVQVLDIAADNETLRLSEAMRATSLIMTTFSMDGQLLVQNPASLACYDGRKRPSENLTDLEAQFANKEDAARVLANAAADATANLEAKVITAKGSRTHSISVRRGRDPITGDFIIVLSEEDVTERTALRKTQDSEKKALKYEVEKSTDKLRISLERFELAAQTAAIWDLDIVDDRLFMSPNFLNELGYTEEDFEPVLRAQHFEDLIHADDIEKYRLTIQEHLASTHCQLSYEIRFLTKAGETRWFNCQGKCIRNTNGNAIRGVGLLTNITERKELEKKLLVTQRMEAIGQLTGGIAHDFNNLLTIIQNNAELLEESKFTDTNLTHEIVLAVQRGADLTTHLLAFARQQTLIPKSIDLNLLIRELERTLFRAISETVTIKYQTDRDLWHIHADPTRLETALLNLALNARDAMPAGGTLTINARNKVTSEIQDSHELELLDSEYVEISVSDTGDGMSADTLRKAFEPFYTTKGVGQGNGLGLSMVLGFSRQSNGDARIYTQPGEGTTVSFYLPRSDVEQSEQIRTASDILIGNHEHVHILEDNEQVQQTLAKLISSMGYVVTTSNDVMEALDWTSQNPEAHLYLVDILLPGGKSGVDFVRQLKERQPKAKVLFMSGYSENELVEVSGLAQEMNFISKPFEKGALSRSIASTLHGQL